MDYHDFTLQKPGEIHFWHKGRLHLIDALCKQAKLSGGEILDVGCGTGTEMPLLAKYGLVKGLDSDERSLKEVAKKGFQAIKGDLANSVPAGVYDTVGCFDVLEHIEADTTALENLYTILAPKGALLITVPSYPWLYGPHDIALQHFRRYSKKELLFKLSQAGFQVEHVRYWNSILFPIFLILRIIKKTIPMPTSGPISEARSYGPILDRVAYWILSIESNVSFFPFGLSLAIVARKP